MSDENGSFKVTTPLGSAEARGRSVNLLVSVLTLLVACIAVFVLFEHKLDARAESTQLRDTLRELVTVQREANCLLAFEQKERVANIEFCKRMAR